MKKRFDVYLWLDNRTQVWSVLADSYAHACEKIARIFNAK